MNAKLYCLQYIITVTGHGVDYAAGPYSVTFHAESIAALFDVIIMNDDILESDEKFILTVDPSSLPSNGRVTVGIPSNSTVTVIDDEGK